MEVSDYCVISTKTDSKENADAITQLLHIAHIFFLFFIYNM